MSDLEKFLLDAYGFGGLTSVTLPGKDGWSAGRDVLVDELFEGHYGHRGVGGDLHRDGHSHRGGVFLDVDRFCRLVPCCEEGREPVHCEFVRRW